LRVGADGRLRDGVHAYPASYVVVDSRQPIVGRRLARLDEARIGEDGDHSGSLTLWRVKPPLRLARAPGKLPPRADGRGC
jgi:hypothetical protein